MSVINKMNRNQAGLSLVELMIAMVLGLVVVGGVVTIFVANSQTYRITQALSQVQESSRMAFEMLTRDIREAGSSGCGNDPSRVGNVLNQGGGEWWLEWVGIVGYDGNTAILDNNGVPVPAVAFGSGVGERINGTSAIHVTGIDPATSDLTIESHTPASANFKINAPTTDFTDEDVLVICDFSHATIFQVSNYNDNNVTVVHNTGTGTPGNCSVGLGFPSDCSSQAGNPYEFNQNAQIARLGSTIWYVGNNGRAGEGGRSLYRVRLGAGGVSMREEVVSGISDMQITYRRSTQEVFETASSIPNANAWQFVNAVQVVLSADSFDANVTDTPNINNGRLRRQFTSIIGIRNRLE